MLNRRAREETLVLGAATMRPMVEKLLPGAHIVSRPRLSNLTYAGEKKLTRLPSRSAIVAFSADEVYAIAELIRRQRGGAAVVLGALSPRTRNAQVALYQSGDVDYLVATDAIGMGLNLDVNHVVGMNDVAALEAAFAWATNENVFFESLYLEPVMGEGDPGKALEPAFYQRARELSAANGTLLVVDSIQAGIRAQGVLSLVDYPGFTDLPPPDMETYSKAVNAGQFPLSILALTKGAAALYARGIYGNTKTANPRALDVATAVLALLTPAVRTNIRTRGKELLERFATLAAEFPGLVRKVQGTGLLCSIDLAPGTFHVVGKGQLEEYLRRHGIGVIHGGENSLRFTPHFELTTKEIDMLIDALRDSFRNGPRAK